MAEEKPRGGSLSRQKWCPKPVSIPDIFLRPKTRVDLERKKEREREERERDR
jgi:hypothetical protein